MTTLMAAARGEHPTDFNIVKSKLVTDWTRKTAHRIEAVDIEGNSALHHTLKGYSDCSP